MPDGAATTILRSISGVEVSVVDDRRRFDELAPQWNGFVDRCITPSFFLTYEYLASALESHGHGSTLHIVFVWSNSELLGIAPLKIEPRAVCGLGSRTIRPIGTEEAEGSFFILIGNERLFYEAMAAYLAAIRDRWSKILFPLMKTDHPFFTALSNRFSSCRDLIVTRSPGFVHPVVSVTGGWGDYFTTLKPKFIRKLRSGLRKLKEFGELEIFRCTMPRDVREMLGVYLQLEERSWKTSMNSGIRRTESLYELYGSMLERGANQQWVELTFLTAGDRIVAGGIALVYRGDYLYLQTVFDKAMGACSPGMILMTANVWRAFDRGLGTVDFRGNYVEYKQNWANDQWESGSICIRKIFSGDGIAYVGSRYVRPSLERLRRLRGERTSGSGNGGKDLPPLMRSQTPLAAGTAILGGRALDAIFDHSSPALGGDRETVAAASIEHSEIDILIARRNEARRERDWRRADEIRDYLLQAGVRLFDSPDGTTWSAGAIGEEEGGHDGDPSSAQYGRPGIEAYES